MQSGSAKWYMECFCVKCVLVHLKYLKSTALGTFSFIYHACVKNLLRTSHRATGIQGICHGHFLAEGGRLFKDVRPCWGKVVTTQRGTCTFSEPEISMHDLMEIFGALG